MRVFQTQRETGLIKHTGKDVGVYSVTQPLLQHPVSTHFVSVRMGTDTIVSEVKDEPTGEPLPQKP